MLTRNRDDRGVSELPASPGSPPAARARVATTGLTVVLALGSVVLMADAEAEEASAEQGHALGVVAGHHAPTAALMGAADPGVAPAEMAGSHERPARLGVADVS